MDSFTFLVLCFTTLWIHLYAVPVEPTPSIEHPGIIGRFTQSGFNNIMRNVVPKLGEEIADMELPDYSGNFRRAFGKVSYKVSRINLIDFIAPLADLTSMPGKGVKLTLSNATAVINGSWEYSYKAFFLKVGDNGTFVINGTGMGLSLEVLFDTAESGYPNMTIGNCDAALDDVDIIMSGGASWLYNLFSKKLSKAIQNDVNEQVCNEIRDYVGRFGDKLHALNLSTPVLGGRASIDFKMVQPPLFTADYVDVFFTGKIHAVNATDEERVEVKAEWMNRTDVMSKMMYIWISDYVFNTMGQFLYESGMMQYTLHPLNIGDIPMDSDFHSLLPLETYALRRSFPELHEQFSNRLVQLGFRLTAPPTFKTSAAGQLMTVNSAVTLGAVDENGEGETVATIQVELDILIKPTLDAEHLSAVAGIQRFHTGLESSTFKASRKQEQILQKALLLLVEDAGLPWLNGILGHGIVFPVLSPDWRFNNAQVTTYEGYMLVETDFGLVPVTEHEIPVVEDD